MWQVNMNICWFAKKNQTKMDFKLTFFLHDMHILQINGNLAVWERERVKMTERTSWKFQTQIPLGTRLMIGAQQQLATQHQQVRFAYHIEQI